MVPHEPDARRGDAWGRPGGDWAGMRPAIDNPFTWSVPVARVNGVTIRIHLLFIAFIAIELGRAVVPVKGQHLSFVLVALSVGVLVTVVLVHELGHCLACRAVGGEADEILMWPLGGLAACHPPPTWRAHVITAMGGPLVNLAVCALAGSMLGLITGKWLGVAVPNILDPFAVLIDPALSRSWAHIALYMFNAISLSLLAFNLLPMFPLDGGRIAQGLFWPRLGWSRSMRLAVRMGYVTGLSLAVFGAVTNNWPLIAVAIFGLWSCSITHRQLEFSDSVLAMESDAAAIRDFRGEGDVEPVEAVETSEGAPSTMIGDDAEGVAVDRILQKIASEGLSALSASERSLLAQETERRRRGQSA